MLKKIKEFMAEYDMTNAGDTVVCGLSGGADSVSLLLAMRILSGELGIAVEAIHVNHCLRNDESDRDESFCRELCNRLNVPFIAVSCDVRRFAEENSLSIEDAARRMRYSVFREYSAGKKIATAHNADDNLETVILNLTRGTALKGLSGIPPVRNGIIRPLLTVSRREIEEFLTSHGQNYVTDSTNLTEDYTRNKIRHRIIPVMRELNSSITATSVTTLAGLRSENELIEAQVTAAEEKCLNDGVFRGLGEYPEVIRRRCISRMLSKNGLPVSYKRLADCDRILLNGGKLDLSGDRYFVSDRSSAGLRTIVPNSGEVVSKPLVIGENSIFSGVRLVCEVMECDNCLKIEDVNKKLTFYLLDCDKIKGEAVVRSRKYGDRIKLSGRNFTSSVKKLINEKVPTDIRPTLHFIEDEEGTIMAEGIGTAQRAIPDENSRKILKITVFRD